MRDLHISEENWMTIFDVASGSKIRLKYENPNTEERLQYNSDIVKSLSKNQDAKDALKVQLEYAEKKLTGFYEGDFGVNGKPISSDTESENYYQGWKGLIRETAGDILITFSKTIFGEPNYVVKDDLDFLEKPADTMDSVPPKNGSSA